MADVSLACTARDCGLLLERAGRTLKCARGHSYDVARSGYVNLLQPQDRRSLAAGDAKDVVTARARLLEAGVGVHALDAVAARVAGLTLPDTPLVVDLGCGTGHALAAIRERRSVDGIGVDLSVAAIDYAARRFPDFTWVVANADRTLPLLDRSVDLLVSVHGRRNPHECNRVLTRAGWLLVAVPAHDDLAELRASVLGEARERDRVDEVAGEFAPHFSLVDHTVARERRTLEEADLRNLLRTTYRGRRHSAAERVAALTSLEVTLASEILLLQRARP